MRQQVEYPRVKALSDQHRFREGASAVEKPRPTN